MRRSIVLYILFGLIFSLNCNAQKGKMKLIYKNGEVREVIGNTPSTKNVTFRDSAGAKKEKVPFSDLTKVIMIDDEGNEASYIQLKVSGWKKPKVVRVVSIGRLNLYAKRKTGGYYNAGGMGFNGTSPMGVGYTVGYDSNKFFLRKADSEQAISFDARSGYFNGRFKTSGATYFKDCPELSEKISNKEFKKEDIIEIVEYYNTKCQL